MEMIQWVIIAIAIIFIIRKFMPVKGIIQMTPQEVKKKLKDKQVQFIDVRTPQEYNSKYQKPFENIPLPVLAKRTSHLDKQKEVVIICQSGMRSMRAAKILKKQGFEKIINVKGGMGAWV
ncbi:MULTISPECIES: rhodanese-like domain-containing protein [Clostridia]|uniref:rhodanese-like domain-containing protein n=1 Tax=Clostridia TaxID=186801 RepID=UPI000EA1318C|nr:MULTISPECIES: rhodanese-like domain-containing protein [Clostridia]NBJ69427.1 rhodanese-like domain-containing protein [Roseburia sp. 1XD42-34]RKI78823.1 rhodanese-like domain-containing protein [Clostridium sp. 1xD42-85]